MEPNLQGFSYFEGKGDEASEMKIETPCYFSAYQFQANMVDVPRDFNITADGKIMVNIEGNTSVMYHFL